MSQARFTEVRPRTSVDQLLRTVQQHHVHLSALADTKAGLIITISSIVLTIALSRAADPQLRAALLTLAVACLAGRRAISSSSGVEIFVITR